MRTARCSVAYTAATSTVAASMAVVGVRASSQSACTATPSSVATRGLSWQRRSLTVEPVAVAAASMADDQWLV